MEPQRVFDIAATLRLPLIDSAASITTAAVHEPIGMSVRAN
jgi:hypothetical protein